jgi:PAS domain S-box-containing protein
MVPHRPTFLTIPVIAAFILVAAALAVVGGIAVLDHRADAERQVGSELAAIVDLKLDQVVSWRRERNSDASFVANNPQIHRNALLLASGSAPPVARKEMFGWMTSMHRNGQYGRIVAFDRDGRVLMSVPDSSARPGPFASMLIERAASERTVFFSDLTIRDGGEPVLDVIIPIFDGPQAKASLVASVVLSIDPRRVLFPILHSWPVPSASGQLALIRREGAEIVFLTEVRDTSVHPLGLRVPLDSSALPAAQGLRGQGGLLHGTGFGGGGVLAVLRPVPETDWFLQAQVDEDEVFSPVGEYTRFMIAVVGLLVAVGAVSLALFLRKKEADHYRNEFERYVERQALVRHFDYLTRYANDIVLLFDDNGMIREINNRGECTYGYDREKLSEMNAGTLGFWPEDPQEAGRIRRELDADISEHHGVLFEADHRRSDGTSFPAEVSARRLTVENGRFIHAIIRDISERRRSEQALISAKERAEEAGVFRRVLLENMSHELRTPMQGILGFARLLASGSRDATQREMAGNILASGRRLMSTLDSILLLSELEAGTLAPRLPVQRVDELVESTARAYAGDAGAKGLEYRVVCHVRTMYAALDPDLFRRALGYLVENAIKFTPSGSVSIEVKSVVTEGTESMGISVTDTGIGIARHHQGVIFEAFRQASAGMTRDYEGAGLGLTLAGRIAKAMGGVLTVDSAEGKGSSFTMVFPCAPTPSASNVSTLVPSILTGEPRPLALRPTVLLVEDNFLNAVVARQFLEGVCDVVHAPDGPRALNTARERHFSLVLMDIHLGAGMDGVEVVEEMRKLPGYLDVPVAAVTGYTNPMDRARFESAGMAHFLAKPYDKSDMVALVSAVLGVVPGPEENG